MKKLLLIFIIIAGCGIFITKSNATVKNATSEVSVTTADVFTAPALEDKEKDKKKTEETKACAEVHVVPANSSTETQVTGCSEAQKQSCAAAQKSCCSEKKKE
jgi:cytoskeletal protein RodZ